MQSFTLGTSLLKFREIACGRRTKLQLQDRQAVHRRRGAAVQPEVRGPHHRALGAHRAVGRLGDDDRDHLPLDARPGGQNLAKMTRPFGGLQNDVGTSSENLLVD